MSGPHCTAPTLEKKLSIASKNDRNESPRLASSSTGGQPHRGLVGRGRVGPARPAPVAVLPAARVDAMASHERRQYLALPAPWGFLTTVLSRAQQSCLPGNSFVKNPSRGGALLEPGRRARQAEHCGEGLRRARPVLDDERGAGVAEHGSEGQG